MSSLRRKTGSDEAEVDMTPMLDIVFIMLIFFIVTATFVQESGLDVTRPDTSDAPPPDTKSITILLTVRQNGDIWMETPDQRQIDIRSVTANVGRVVAENPGSSVIVQAHPDSDSGIMIEVMDQAKAGGAAVSIGEPG